MKVFKICIGQETPEWICEDVGLLADDITDAMVIGMELVSALKEGLSDLNVTTAKYEHLRIQAISEESMIANPDHKLSRKTLQEMVNSVRVQVE